MRTRTPGRDHLRARVIRVDAGAGTHAEHPDVLAAEEPLEIRVTDGGPSRRVAVTMRTPGSDFELAAGFLYSEGLLTRPESLRSIAMCTDSSLTDEQRDNTVTVTLDALPPNLPALERHFMISSACGVCGRDSLDTLFARPLPPLPIGTPIAPAVLTALPERLRADQPLFERTGGLHAAALFDHAGTLLAAREDIGRHNALDKLVGWALLERRLPLSDVILLLSGRASFEMVQKAAAAGLPVVCAVSAPSSLALRAARRAGMTLIGFLRGSRFTVYSGAERLAL